MINIVEKIDDLVSIKNVLISVSDKSNLESLVNGLVGINPDIRIISTGGTYAAIREVLGTDKGGILKKVSEYTGQPETQGGLVKTLDFKIYLGLLTEKYNEYHSEDLKRTGAMHIDMVVVNLYPFEKTISEDNISVERARANIDIGGPTMIRAASKNYLRVACICDPFDYTKLIQELESNNGSLSLSTRFELAKKAFHHTAAYDRCIADYLGKQAASGMKESYSIVNS
ncbi:MAG: hypothetical protein PVI26_06290 [Chitinispirillia bacterium]|jgi:phosphoribosylaminoimidazolecarboxamide formyltransferase/IMP cyclohydrolase